MHADSIKENLKTIEKKIEKAAIKSGRKRDDILLVCVSKTIEVHRIKEAVDLGYIDLGENKVQEIMDKHECFDESVNWHLIGHLQTNKVKYIIDKVEMIHSVESLKLANEINKRAAWADKIMNVLVEVNVAGEESKFGIKPKELTVFVEELSKLTNICVKGLMTVAPFVENGELNRMYFKQMRQLLVDINQKRINNINMEVLSMGMTGDYEVAIEEGANIVRVGTGIFGSRIYT